MRHSRTTLALAAVLSPVLAAAPATSHAADTLTEWAFDRAGSCMTSLSGKDSADWDAGSRCVGDRLGGLLVDAAARLATEQGRRVFGENFSLVHRMSWSPLGRGLAGELDAVVPLAYRGRARSGADAPALPGSALFLQQGMTRWTDGHGLRRNDVRLGGAWRFAAGADVYGATALVQENLERGHQRIVLGTDYAGRWGHVSLQHYVPTTEWRPGRSGYEERAVGGTELGARFDLTTTVSLDTALGRWERDDTGRSTVDGRLGFGWRPHPYLRMDAHTGLGSGADGESYTFSLDVPFGGPRKRTKWAGLGAFAMARNATAGDLWRPVENVGRIRTIERAARQNAGGDGVTVRFLQSSAASGGTVEVEVALSAPASEEVRLSVRLAPGSGDNPAVAGVDYVDEPALVTIPQGATSGRATFRLLVNPTLDTDRTLTVTVARA